MKQLAVLLLTTIILSSCVAKKEFVALQEKHEQTKTELVNVKTNLQKCIIEQEKENTRALSLAEQVKALKEDKNFLAGLNVHKGMVTYKAVADVFGHEFVEPEKAITS